MESEWLSEAEAVFGRISRAQEEASAGFGPDLSGARDRVEDGRPLVAPEDVRVDRRRFEHLLATILDILEDWTGESAFPDGAADGGFGLSDGDLGPLLAAAIGGAGALEKRAEELGRTPEPFACAVRYAFAPFLRAYARELSERLEDTFESEPLLAGRCPVCGAEPFMGEFDEADGRRRLACGLCGTRWRFPRLECPFCSNRDQKRLGFLAVEGPGLAPGYRVDVCEKCRRYVKTVDRRTLKEPITLDLAEVLTPELDEAAMERGYGLCSASDG